MERVPMRPSNANVNNRSVQQPAQPMTKPAAGSTNLPPIRRRKSAFKRIGLPVIASLLLIGLLVAGYFGYQKFFGPAIKGNQYQAVFLTSGQVYFGKLDNLGGDYSRLKDVFYIQATETDTEEDAQNPQTENASATDLQLIKLGSEVHGPEDEMLINKDQILFVENLKSDGKVSTSIKQYYDSLKQ